MLRSMTGFGAAAAEVEGVRYAVEARSVNNRYLKGVIRLPDGLSQMEACLLYTSPSPRDRTRSRMPSSA